MDPRDTEAIDSIIYIIKENLNSIPEEFRYEFQQVILDVLDRIKNRKNTGDILLKYKIDKNYLNIILKLLFSYYFEILDS